MKANALPPTRRDGECPAPVISGTRRSFSGPRYRLSALQTHRRQLDRPRRSSAAPPAKVSHRRSVNARQRLLKLAITGSNNRRNRPATQGRCALACLQDASRSNGSQSRTFMATGISREFFHVDASFPARACAVAHARLRPQRRQLPIR